MCTRHHPLQTQRRALCRWSTLRLGRAPLAINPLPSNTPPSSHNTTAAEPVIITNHACQTLHDGVHKNHSLSCHWQHGAQEQGQDARL
jgi:hypothetical protein